MVPGARMLAQFASVCVIHPKALKSRVSKAMGGTSPGRSLLRSPSMLLWLGCRTRPPSSDVGGHRLACMALKLTGLHPPVACELQSPAASLRPWWPVASLHGIETNWLASSCGLRAAEPCCLTEAMVASASNALRALCTADDDRPPTSKAFMHARLLAHEHKVGCCWGSMCRG